MDRRTMLAGMIAFAGEGLAGAAARQRPLFEGTPLAGNAIARTYQRVNLALPAARLVDEHGAASLAGLRGRTTILSLWAEWCAPCLAEMRDLAAIRRKYAGSRFDILAVLTESRKPLDFHGARERLASMGAGNVPLMIEPDGGARMLDGLSAPPPPSVLAMLPKGYHPKGSLPCNLLVDSSGRVRGRSLGAPDVQNAGQKPGAGPQTLTEAQEQAMLSGASRTAWSTALGDQFARALASGLLDRIR
ncbi:MAG TPA: TlpA disulfide reductase family protein [Allosphingosinicella sp.]|nr:TlpA disulfide reductase family protein [Allosphingosinicella sp.]